MPFCEAPSLELGSAPRTPSLTASPSPSEISSSSSLESPNIRATPLFRALTIRPPEPEQPPGQDELERRLPGYRRIVIPRELTLIELLKQSSGVTRDDEVLHIHEARLRVIAERVGLRRLHVLAPRLRQLTLDGSAMASLRDLGVGLVHLKILSIKRCNLTSLDGVWGLGGLRELNAAANRLQDLQPLAALQKLHTLDLSDNPIAESSRIWTLGVCGALRRLSLNGTPASSTPDYRSRVAAALPMLVYLDERPLHTDIHYECDEELSSSSSDSDVEEYTQTMHAGLTEQSLDEAKPGPSTQLKQTEFLDPYSKEESEVQQMSRKRLSRRPATTENAGVRPPRTKVSSRPRTAQDRSNIDEPTRLQILHTLMDDEWLASGSKLTSLDAVCGNLARAMRRTSSAYQRYHKAEKEEIELTMENASRAAAAEIPRAPRLEDWIKFKEDTGIEIDININNRPECLDPSKCLDRLEQIEKETQERFKEESRAGKITSAETSSGLSNTVLSSSRNDIEFWTHSVSMHTGLVNPNSDINMFFDDVRVLHSVNRESFTLPE